MSALDRIIVEAAVAVSPAAHREVRREQWLADVRDARELDLSPTALAFGALTTALFHRRAGHRSTWGESMTAAPLHVRPAAHTIRTVPVLVGLAFLSFLAVPVWVIMLPNYEYSSTFDLLVAQVGWLVLQYLLPGAALVTAILLLDGVPIRRRRLGASIMAAAALGLVVYPLLGPDTDLPIEVLPPLAGLVAWLVATAGRRWAWIVLVAPLLVDALHYTPLYAYAPGRVWPFLVVLTPVATVIVGIVVTKFSTGAAVQVEQHGEPLVDKSA
ncbi:hypothetical protein FHW23_002725 [Curtobacterium pusillum]|uniref:Uncharacterized protein n=1 Tax=Curtobacterium pusillum TaxID=69373 RepID=A0AAW3T936_9MICO|nr:hypothetical protein [Curtobacterium pusillum]